MAKSWLTRVGRAVQWRLLRRTKFVVFYATRLVAAPAPPPGFSPVRVSRDQPAAVEDAQKAMRAAGEPAGLVAARIAAGEEFFGWRGADGIVAFCWVTYANRSVGPCRLRDVPGRVFFYNGHTLRDYRGRGLFQALLFSMQQQLSAEGAGEFVCEVHVRNAASTRGVGKAGFRPVADVAWLTLFNRWECCVRRVRHDPSLPDPFAT
jgi:hypothetical protein